MGGLIELIQPYFGRHQSLIDLGYDLIGCLAAGIFYLRRRVKAKVFQLALFLLSMSLLSLSLIIPISKLHTAWEQYQGLPVLMNFDRAWEDEIRRFNPSTKFRVVSPPAAWKNKTQVAEVTFGLDFQYPGFSIPYVYGDWSTQKGLIVDIYSEETEVVTLIVRIHDEYHDNRFEDRFNRRITIKPGLNNVLILLDDIRKSPELRGLRVDKIASMSFFMTARDAPVTLFFDNIKLK